ncbi:MAG: DUF1576 domain-containing protein [Aerococcaceae bacterium]|nr:DUF1576 domain-containing protein [Aerococcaceae bacterium]
MIHLYPKRKQVVFGLGVVTLIYALLMPDRRLMLTNYWHLLMHQTYLMHDAFEIAGLSATFLNVALHFFVAFYLMSRNERSNLSGLQMAALGIFVGHAFFGTHIINILPIIAGVVLYAHWTHQSYKLYTTISLFATATAPIVSYVLLTPSLSFFSVITALGMGLFLGFIAPPLAEQFLKFHHGLTLYNFGFTTGIIAMFIVAMFPYFKAQVPTQSLISQQYHVYLVGYVCLMLILLALLLWNHWRDAFSLYKNLLDSSGHVPDDFVSKFGIYPTLLNMILTTGLFLGIVLALRFPFNGTTVGGLSSIAGFSAFGKHVRNATPVAIGVTIATLLLGNSLVDQRFVITLLFGTALSPIAGFYGVGYGILAGFLHYNLTVQVFPLHQGMGLYNNGFSSGFVAAFLVPIIDTFQDFNQQHIRRWIHAIRKK